MESLVALGTSGLIFYVGYEICAEVLAGPRMLPTQIPWAVVGIGSTIVITWWFSRYELKKGRETGSPSLVADARHVWSDMLSSLVILVSLLGAATGVYLDHYAALVVVVFIGRTAIGIFLDAVRVLLDASLDNTSLNRIRILENPYLEEEKSKGIKVAEWLLENGLDVLISHHDQASKGPQFVLGNSGAEILLTEERQADNVLSMVQAKTKKYTGRNAAQMESTS